MCVGVRTRCCVHVGSGVGVGAGMGVEGVGCDGGWLVAITDILYYN